MGVAAGLPWTFTTCPCTESASGCSQILPVPREHCGSESGPLAPHVPSPSCHAVLGLACYSQNTLRATAHKHPWSGCSQGARVSGCCSLWHSAVLAVHVWAIWAPGECSSHRFVPPPLLPCWGDGAHDAYALAMPAAQQCLHHSPHRLRAALCHSQSQISVCQQRGEGSTAENPRHCVFPFWPKLSLGGAGCWAWVLPRFRRAQGGPGFGVVVSPRGRRPRWVAVVTRQQG